LVEQQILEVLQVLQVEVQVLQVEMAEAQEETERKETVLEVGTAAEEIKAVQRSWYLRLVESEAAG